MPEFPVVVSDGSGEPWHGQPFRAASAAEAMKQARELAAGMAAGTSFKLIGPDGTTLREYSK